MAKQEWDITEMYSTLRCAILEKLRQQGSAVGKKQQYHKLNSNEVKSLFPNRTFSEPEQVRIAALVCQIYHELYLERIIIPGTARFTSTDSMAWPFYYITDYGRQVLQTSEYCPHDPDGYIQRLKSEIADLDETIIRYVEESLRCLRANCLLAAAVTIGCASEQAMLLLIELFGQYITDPSKKKEYENATSSWIISRKYKAFRNYLDQIAKGLPEHLRTSLEQQLHGTFDLIRQIRNDAGHPTGGSVTSDLIRSSHIGFPGYCRYVYALMDHIRQNGVTL